MCKNKESVPEVKAAGLGVMEDIYSSGIKTEIEEFSPVLHIEEDITEENCAVFNIKMDMNDLVINELVEHLASIGTPIRSITVGVEVDMDAVEEIVVKRNSAS